MPDATLPDGYSIRTLDRDALGVLTDLLPRLADYHNRMAATFAGVYPVRTIAKQITETETEMKEHRALVEVLYRGETAVGFAKASFEDGLGFVDWLYLDDDVRGAGLGKLLLDRLLEYFRANRVRLVDLMVVNGNPAVRFYEKAGFVKRTEMLSMALDVTPAAPEA